MHIQIIVSLIVFTVCFTVQAKPKAYIGTSDDFFSRYKIIIDDKVFTQGLNGYRGLPEAMSSDPLAKALAEDYENYQSWGTGTLWSGLAGALTYSFATDSDDFNSGTYWSIFGAGLISSIFFHSIANKKLTRSINQYNGVYTKERRSWNIGPATKGLGVSLNF